MVVTESVPRVVYRGAAGGSSAPAQARRTAPAAAPGARPGRRRGQRPPAQPPRAAAHTPGSGKPPARAPHSTVKSCTPTESRSRASGIVAVWRGRAERPPAAGSQSLFPHTLPRLPSSASTHCSRILSTCMLHCCLSLYAVSERQCRTERDSQRSSPPELSGIQPRALQPSVCARPSTERLSRLRATAPPHARPPPHAPPRRRDPPPPLRRRLPPLRLAVHQSRPPSCFPRWPPRSGGCRQQAAGCSLTGTPPPPARRFAARHARSCRRPQRPPRHW